MEHVRMAPHRWRCPYVNQDFTVTLRHGHEGLFPHVKVVPTYVGAALQINRMRLFDIIGVGKGNKHLHYIQIMEHMPTWAMRQ